MCECIYKTYIISFSFREKTFSNLETRIGDKYFHKKKNHIEMCGSERYAPTLNNKQLT